MGEMNFGKLETSELLQQTLAVLQHGGVKTSLEIAQATASLAVHSDIAALRKNGLQIETRYLGKIDGRRRFGYLLRGALQ